MKVGAGRFGILRGAVGGDAPEDVVAAPVDQGEAVEGVAEAAVRGAHHLLAVDGHGHGAEGIAGPFDDVGALVLEDQRPGHRIDDADAAPW